jgi:putative membrane protein
VTQGPGLHERGHWRRVHPLTPAVRSWQALVVLMFVVAQEFGRSAVDPSEGGPSLPDVGGQALLAGGGIAVAVVLAFAGFAVLSWRMTRFRVTDEALEYHHGVLFRQERRARLDRLQAVDVVEPLVARIFGLAKLSLDVAGGGHSKIEVSYLTRAQAQELRNHLLAAAAGVRYDTPTAPEAPEHQWLEVPVQRLLTSLALTPGVVVPALISVGLIVVAVVLRNPGLLLPLFPGLVGFGGVVWNRFAGAFGFRVATSPDGLRLRHGLLEQRAQTVPPGRVQAVRLSQPILWRGPDWWRVQVNVAGYGGMHGENKGDTETTLLPVGTRDEAVAVLAFVLPDLGVTEQEHPRAVVDAGLSGSGAAQGFRTAPESARWLDPWAWRRNGFRVTGQALLLRRGFFEKHLDVVPHARTQSLGVTQGPLQRALGLASFVLHSTPGPVSPAVHHLSGELAAQLLTEQSVRARLARSTAGPERWMEAAALSAAEELSGHRVVDPGLAPGRAAGPRPPA